MDKKVLKRVFIYLLVFLVVIVSLLICYLFKSKNDIVLVGDKEVTIRLNEEYKELGYKVLGSGKNYVVVIDNPVNKQIVGEYFVTYSYNDKEIKRKVKVIDDIAPVITLKGKEKVSVCSGKTYKEEGYKVTDNYDKGLNKKVEIKVEKDSITYIVVDSSGNKSEVVRKIVYEDKKAPEFTFDFKDNLTIYKGNKFKNSYKAIDNCDGDITDSVNVTGSVNTKKLGTYKLEYEVSDKSGNKRTISRTIKVIDKPLNRSIYLTFDDGPSEITPKVLDLLKKYDIKATFFVINHNSSLDKYIKRAYDEGHTIAMHSYTHKYSKIYKNDKAYFDDLKKIEDKVIRITGASSKIIRFPGGSSNTISMDYNKGIMSRLSDEVERRGYIYQDWNVGSSDTATQKPNKICNNVKKRLMDGYNIVLMHDYSGNNGTYKALPCIIEYALDNGYTFYALDRNSPVSHHRIAN